MLIPNSSKNAIVTSSNLIVDKRIHILEINKSQNGLPYDNLSTQETCHTRSKQLNSKPYNHTVFVYFKCNLQQLGYVKNIAYKIHDKCKCQCTTASKRLDIKYKERTVLIFVFKESVQQN